MEQLEVHPHILVPCLKRPVGIKLSIDVQGKVFQKKHQEKVILPHQELFSQVVKKAQSFKQNAGGSFIISREGSLCCKGQGDDSWYKIAKIKKTHLLFDAGLRL